MKKAKGDWTWEPGETFSFQDCESKGKGTKPDKLNLWFRGYVKWIGECEHMWKRPDSSNCLLMMIVKDQFWNEWIRHRFVLQTRYKGLRLSELEMNKKYWEGNDSFYRWQNSANNKVLFVSFGLFSFCETHKIIHSINQACFNDSLDAAYKRYWSWTPL